MNPVNRVSAGVEFRVRLTPNASMDRVDGLAAGADGMTYFAGRVRAASDKGLANKALRLLLARFLDVPKSTIAVVRGSTSRLKTVRVEASEEEGNRLVNLLETLDNER
jgi:uncharacterized protein YggU (UPF0235/DUF167 family)